MEADQQAATQQLSEDAEVKSNANLPIRTVEGDDLTIEAPGTPQATPSVPIVDHTSEDDDPNEELTPPPDSLSEMDSDIAYLNGDESLRPTKNEGSSPLQVTSENEDVDMEDDEEQASMSHYPKRKRSSVYENLSELNAADLGTDDEPPARKYANKISKPMKVTHGTQGVKSVPIGFWRASPIVDDQDKHCVVGFIDIRDRLRTRIQPKSRFGKNLIAISPLPPGPGGSWVTFENVAFADHLAGLDHHHVKEYVKIRSQSYEEESETPEQAAELNLAAKAQAIKRLKDHPPAETTALVPIAFGPKGPSSASMLSRPDTKKRKLTATTNTMAPPSEASPTISTVAHAKSEPTRILLGYWLKSNEALVENKHAVYGILSVNNMFRVKLVRETRDGRYVDGNFPAGPGALWVSWEEAELEPHLKNLSRPEIKEYCRIRQRQMEKGEVAADQVANETKAVYEAQTRCRNGLAPASYAVEDAAAQFVELPLTSNGCVEPRTRRESMPHELRPPRPEAPPRPRHSLSATDMDVNPIVHPRAHQGLDSQQYGLNQPDRSASLARREIAKLEAAQVRAEQRTANRDALASAQNPQNSQNVQSGNPPSFQDNVGRLNKVWAAQEASRLKSGSEDTKIYMGIKYERKLNGPFQGKLVSQPTIISIDGEDYIEYRVLTKPSFC